MTKTIQNQEEVLSSLLRRLVQFGGIAYIPSTIACFYEDLYTLAAINTAAYAFIAVITYSRKIGYNIKLISVVSTIILLGGAVLFATGNNGAGHIWLICGVVISSLFGRIPVIAGSIIAAEGILLLYGILVYKGILESGMSITGISAIAANLLLVSITLSLISHNLLRKLNSELEENENLLRFLHHRIKNNLQTVESIISLENSTDEIIRAGKRINAVTSANELLLGGEKSLSMVELLDLVSIFIRPGIDKIISDKQVQIRSEQLTETAIALNDIFESLFPTGPMTIVISSINNSGNLPLAELTIRLKTPFPNREKLEQILKDTLTTPDILTISDSNDSLSIDLSRNNIPG